MTTIPPGMWQDPEAFEPREVEEHRHHEGHDHEHGEGCGHEAEQHDDHVVGTMEISMRPKLSGPAVHTRPPNGPIAK